MQHLNVMIQNCVEQDTVCTMVY